MTRKSRLLLLLLLAAAPGCAAIQGLFGRGKEAAGREAELPPGAQRLSDAVVELERKDEQVVEFDGNGDDKPDVWTYSIRPKAEDGTEGPERRTRKEFDMNYDGRVDLTKFYDAQGNLTKEAYDLDFDGKLDAVHFFENGRLVRKERALNFKEQTDTWVYLERDKVVRKEKDTDGDGRVDYWEYWENGEVARSGEDLDGDGVVDRWSKNPAVKSE